MPRSTLATALVLLSACSTGGGDMGAGVEVVADAAVPPSAPDAPPGSTPDARPPDAQPPDARPPDATPADAAVSPDARDTGAINALLDKCGPGTPKLLPDGTLVSLTPSTRPLVVGAGPDGRDPLPADLDQIRFYDRVLSPDEVARHAVRNYEPCGAAVGCVLEYTFDQTAGGTYPDSSGRSPARIVGTVAGTDGVIGAGARFDGTGHLETAHDDRLAFVHTFSFEAWVRRPGVCPPTFSGRCTMERIFEKGSGLRLDFHVGANWRFQTTPWVFHADGLASKNVWTHLAVTFDDKHGVQYYRNGKPFKSCPVP